MFGVWGCFNIKSQWQMTRYQGQLRVKSECGPPGQVPATRRSRWSHTAADMDPLESQNPIQPTLWGNKMVWKKRGKMGKQKNTTNPTVIFFIPPRSSHAAPRKCSGSFGLCNPMCFGPKMRGIFVPKPTGLPPQEVRMYF